MSQPADRTAFGDAVSATESPTSRALLLGAIFAAATQGALPLSRAMAALRHEIGADTVTLLRIVHRDRPYLVATTAARHTMIEDRVAEFAKTLDGLRNTLKAGQIVRDALRRDQRAVVLFRADAFIDLLIVRDGDPVLLADFAAMAQPTWAIRRAGLIVNAITALQNLTEDRTTDADAVRGCILSARNPAGLTPTEFRVALALRDGQSPATIGQTLSMAMPTVRTHLRNLYAKTGLRGMHELTHRLHADAAA